MKKVFLVIVVPALLVALGFAQTPAASGDTDQFNIRGCMGGTDGSYTVAEDNTGKIFKITTSSVELKAYLGQHVNLIGHKAGAAENGLAVAELNMISEHCTAAAAAPAATAGTPAGTVSTPAAAAPAATVGTPAEAVTTPPAPAAPDTAAPATTGSTPAETVDNPATAAHAATVGTPPEAVSSPPAPAARDTAAAAATAGTPAETGGTPAPAASAAPVGTTAETATAPAAAAAIHRKRPSAQPRKASATPPAVPTEPDDTLAAAAPPAPPGPPSETANTPAAPAVKLATSRSEWMLAPVVVVVLLIGAAVPLFNRWRKRKLLEQTRGQNLSLTTDAKSDPGKSDTTGGRKAA